MMKGNRIQGKKGEKITKGKIDVKILYLRGKYHFGRWAGEIFFLSIIIYLAFRWKMDSAESVLAGALEGHYKMINEFKGVPGVLPEKVYFILYLSIYLSISIYLSFYLSI